MATGDFGPGRMPPDMFLNCNEEIKRQDQHTVRSRNKLVSRNRDRPRIRVKDRNRSRLRDSARNSGL